MEPWVVATSLIFVYLLVTLGVAVKAMPHGSISAGWSQAVSKSDIVIEYLLDPALMRQGFATRSAS